MKKTKHTFTLRVSKPLAATIKQEANEGNLSANQLMEYILECYLAIKRPKTSTVRLNRK